jgi:hypothetical protein
MKGSYKNVLLEAFIFKLGIKFTIGRAGGKCHLLGCGNSRKFRNRMSWNQIAKFWRIDMISAERLGELRGFEKTRLRRSNDA